jgi:hypothetical protein
MKLPGKDTQIYKDVRNNLRAIIEGTMFVVDCSIGSMSSQPGWAIYQSGEYVSSGVLHIDPRGEKWTRLHELHRLLRNKSLEAQPDICVFEQVPVTGHGRNQTSHASLLYAVGVTMAAVQADAFIGLTPIVWKSRVRPGYVKSDERDALEMGYIMVEIARAIAETDPHKYYGNRG